VRRRKATPFFSETISRTEKTKFSIRDWLKLWELGDQGRAMFKRTGSQALHLRRRTKKRLLPSLESKKGRGEIKDGGKKGNFLTNHCNT